MVNKTSVRRIQRSRDMNIPPRGSKKTEGRVQKTERRPVRLEPRKNKRRRSEPVPRGRAAHGHAP